MQRKAAGEELKRETQFTQVLVGEPLRLTLQRQYNYEKQRQFIEFSYLITLKQFLNNSLPQLAACQTIGLLGLDAVSSLPLPAALSFEKWF
jgi:hypothetical protein